MSETLSPEAAIRARSQWTADRGASIPQTPQMLNHLAYVTHDAEATVDFYTNVLGLEFVLAVMDDKIPSTGDPFPYLHIFFRLGDGSTLAFFEAPNLPHRTAVPHPAYDIFDHLALEVDSVETVDEWAARLRDLGLAVLGPVDHKIIYSIYFHDPVNDIRLEITTPTMDDWNDRGPAAWDALNMWADAKARAERNDADPSSYLVNVISATMKNRPGDGAM